MPPLFRQSPAAVDCDKDVLRWPGPFGSGFLSPQPPGAVRIGPVAVTLFTRASTSWSFFLLGTRFLWGCRGAFPTDGKSRRRVSETTRRWCARRFSKISVATISGAEISAATCRPRPASAPAGRGCRPEHRRQRRRRPRARRFRSARSSFRQYRSSRPPSTGSVPRCSR
jgi:hypothetical protein